MNLSLSIDFCTIPSQIRSLVAHLQTSTLSLSQFHQQIQTKSEDQRSGWSQRKCSDYLTVIALGLVWYTHSFHSLGKLQHVWWWSKFHLVSLLCSRLITITQTNYCGRMLCDTNTDGRLTLLTPSLRWQVSVFFFPQFKLQAATRVCMSRFCQTLGSTEKDCMDGFSDCNKNQAWCLCSLRIWFPGKWPGQ